MIQRRRQERLVWLVREVTSLRGILKQNNAALAVLLAAEESRQLTREE